MSDTDPSPQLFGKLADEKVQPKARQPPKDKRNGRGRLFSLISYATEDDLKKVIHVHEEQIRYWCYIVHDKDRTDDGELKEVHKHVLFDLYNANTCSAVKKWFSWCVDDKGERANTLVEVGGDRQLLCEYLTHSNDGEKYQYSEKDIVNYPDMILLSGVKARNDEDKALNILDDMMLGMTYFELVRHYGREFIINCSRYEGMIARMISDGSLPDYLTPEQKNKIYFRYREVF